MKYISTLFVIVLLAVGTVNAQTASKLNSQSYTYMMKNADGTGEEIIDKITFGVGQVTSQELSKSGFTSGKVMEKNAGATSNFELAFTKPNGNSYMYKGVAEGTVFHGTITVTDNNGATSEMLFRGMLTEEWDNMMKEKEAARKQMDNKQ